MKAFFLCYTNNGLPNFWSFIITLSFLVQFLYLHTFLFRSGYHITLTDYYVLINYFDVFYPHKTSLRHQKLLHIHEKFTIRCRIQCYSGRRVTVLKYERSDTLKPLQGIRYYTFPTPDCKFRVNSNFECRISTIFVSS